MDLPAGTILGDSYRIARPIGIGGMGAIYEAAHLGSGKRVAVKMMSRELAAHPEALARFRREVKVTTELAHPHIVDVFDFGAAPTGEPYLVMEFLDGEDLEQRLERDGPVPLAMAAEIVNQVASALAVAHEEGVVHRDLKPGNIFLVKAAGGGVFVKIVDFGISKVLRSATTKLTMARAVVGTPEFMSPEQAAGRVDWVDHRSDQWALACLAWHMLSGRLPFWKPEVNAILTQVISEEPTPLEGDRAALIPSAIDKVLRRALSKRREDRFPIITAFARAFAAAAGAPAHAPRSASPRREKARRPRRQGRAALWLSLCAVGLIAVAGWVFRAEIMASKWWPGGPSATERAPAGGGQTDDGPRHRRRPGPRK